MPATRLIRVSPSDYDHERRALDHLERVLPDHDPFLAWSNFEFTTADGTIYEVDALVISPAGIFLVEIKSWEGALVAGPNYWDYTSPGGRTRVVENPRLLAERKSKRLAGLLGRHWPNNAGRMPRVEAVVWLSEQTLDVRFEDRGAFGLVFHGAKSGLPSVDAGLVEGNVPGVRPVDRPLNRIQMKALRRAMEAIGIRAVDRRPRVGDWELGALLAEGPGYQDYLAVRPGLNTKRRARVFTGPGARDGRERLEAAARRTFQVVEALRYEHVLAAKDLVDGSRGPAVLFEHPDGFVRLDAFVSAAQSKLDVRERIKIAVQVAQTVQFAHNKGVVHRALSPYSVLIDERFPHASTPDTRLLDWHLAASEGATTGGTIHLADWQAGERTLFLAPEALADATTCREEADVFGLGALLGFLLTGALPAQDLADRAQRFATEGCLRPSTRADGVQPALDDLVAKATASNPADRHRSVANFIEALDDVVRDLDRDDTAERDVLDTPPGDLIADRFLVERRLGRGSTSTALLVHDTQNKDAEVVLKIALDPTFHATLEAEAEAIAKVRSEHVAKLLESCVLEPGSRQALVLQLAGTETLRDELRARRTLSLDDLHRFGDDLCTLLVDLENAGVLHRDIKPENLGLYAPDKVRKRLLAFDFSLASTPVTSTRVGTPGYIDPFVNAPNRGRQDEYFDRYATAVTLHEMATGRKPRWGEPECDPAVVLDAPLVLSESLLPLAVRDALIAFFTRAFARNLADRYDNAEEMRTAWRGVFATTLHSEPLTDGSDAIARMATLTAESSVSELGLSAAAVDALDGEGVRTVGALISFPRLDFFPASGEVRSELLEVRNAARDLIAVDEAEPDPSNRRDPAHKSIDDLVQYLGTTRKASGFTSNDDRFFALRLLGLDAGGSSAHTLPFEAAGERWRWPDLATVAEQEGVSVAVLRSRVAMVAEHWARRQAFGPLVDDVARLLRRHDHAMTVLELGRALLSLRGSLADDATRDARACAVVRAVIYANDVASERAFELVRRPRALVVCSEPALRDALPSLGDIADRLVADHQIVSPTAAFGDLAAPLPEALRLEVRRARLARIAAASSAHADISTRGELYPVGLDPDVSLSALARSLSAIEEITEQGLRERVRERFPLAAVLPPLDELKRRMQRVGMLLEHDGDTPSEGARFRGGRLHGPHFSTRTSATSTVYAGAQAFDANARALREAQAHLAHLVTEGGFCAMLAEPRHALSVAAPLATAYGLELVSSEALFLDAIAAHTASGKPSLELILRADADGDRRSPYFMKFLPSVRATVRGRLQQFERPVLLVENGLFARLDAMALVEQLRVGAGKDGWPPRVWMLLPVDQSTDRPHIDGTDIPTVYATERYRLPRAYASVLMRTGDATPPTEPAGSHAR